jgi:AraC-like DNA-binding protein
LIKIDIKRYFFKVLIIVPIKKNIIIGLVKTKNMFHLKYILTSIILFNYAFTIQKIYDDKVFYNFVTYQNELYISSNNGIYKINSSGDDLTLFDGSIIGPINSIFQKNNNFKIKFIKSPLKFPDFYSTSTSDFAYLENTLFIISRGKLLIYKDLSYEFKPFESVRSITKNAVGSYNGIYIKGKKLNKITYTDGQIKEFDSITFVCYNGLLSYKKNKETKIYSNDNSIRSKGEYGVISDIFLINNFEYLVLSDKGIYNYNNETDTFKLIYTSQKKIIPIRNKIQDRIKDREEFHFIDDNQYISLNVIDFKTEIIENKINYKINDILESDLDGNNFYAISENKLLLSFKRTKNGLMLKSKTDIRMTAHTISDYNDLIFLSGNKGLSIFSKTKKNLYDGYIIDEFNKSAVYKSDGSISFGSVHGIYSIREIKKFNNNLIFKDYRIDNNRNYLYVGIIAIIIILMLIIKRVTKKNITNDQLVSNIKRFIRGNLNRVTLKMLEIEFNLDYYEINSLNKDFKPAQFIKTERKELAKKMLLNKKSISEIGKKTGYSETYLLKNKYKFLR